MKNRILMRIDFQNDFVHPHGSLTIANSELIEKHQKFTNNLQTNMFDLIIDTYDTHFTQTYHHTSESKKFPPHCIFDTWGWESAAPFKPTLKVMKLFKSTTNIWHEKHAYDVLDNNWQDKEVYLCGVLSDICVVQALNGLLKRKANVIILEDLCQGAARQISEILTKEIYQPFLESGQLRTQTTAQFFRSVLLEKKIEHNLVHINKGNSHEK